MLEDVELYVFNKYIKGMIVEENGVKKISKKSLENLKLSPHEKNFIMYIINNQKIKITEEKNINEDRSPYVRDNNYGDIQTHELQKVDEPVMSEIEYSSTNEKIFEDYKELDEYLENRFIPTYILLKQRKNEYGEIESFPSIRLHHIMALKLSEAELEHVMNYLKEKNIRVGGKGSTLDKEFENYDYVTTYKESALPLTVPADVTLKKISLYKQNKDKKLRDEIITDNMRLVPHVAYRYALATGIDIHELESYGYEGLIIALENFSINYGYAFSTYAVACIRGYILSGIPKILNNKRDNFYYNYVNAKAAVEKECGTTLAESPELIEDVIDLLVATGKIKGDDAKKYARRRINSMVIGDASLDDDETMEELLNNGQLVDTHDYAEEVMNEMSKSALEEALSTLTVKEQEVLRLRFGLYGDEPKTLEEIGKMLNVTSTRIRDIQIAALRKLRRYNISKKLKDFVDQETERYMK